MNPKHPARIALTILALCLALAMLGGGGWVLYWYWRTGGVIGTTSAKLSEENKAAIATSGLTGRQQVTSFLSGKGFVGGARGNWHVNAGPFQMHMVQAPEAVSYNYRFTTQRAPVFTGEDQKLMQLGYDLSNNNFIQQDSGVKPDVIAKLKNSPADWLTYELKVSDALAQPCEDLWVKYVLATVAADREKIGELIDAVRDACEKSVVADKAGFAADVAIVRAIIPVDQEKAYNDAVANARKARNIRNAPRPPATRPAAATKPAARPATQPAHPPIIAPPVVPLVAAPATSPSTQP